MITIHPSNHILIFQNQDYVMPRQNAPLKRKRKDRDISYIPIPFPNVDL